MFHIKPKTSFLNNIKDNGATTTTTTGRENSSRHGQVESGSSLGQQEAHVVPKTASEFCRTWRRTLKNPDEKVAFLHFVTPAHLQRLFHKQVEIEPDMIADIVQCLHAAFKNGQLNPHNDIDDFQREQSHVALTLATLQVLSTTHRFHLTLSFLDERQQQHLRSLFHHLELVVATNGAHVESQVHQLRVLFQL